MDDKTKVNEFEKSREQGTDVSHSAAGSNPRQGAATDKPGDKDKEKDKSKTPDPKKPHDSEKDEDDEEEEEEKPETPLTDEAMDQEGDPEKGHYTAKELADRFNPRLIPIRDRRAYLIDQALKNEAVHDEFNAHEVQAINDRRKKFAMAVDLDQIREDTLAAGLAQLDLATDEGQQNIARNRQAMAEARRADHNPTPVPGDTSGGIGGGSRPENQGA